jgi:hypothetical protein
MKKQIVDNWLDLAALPDTAVIRDRDGDVFERRGGVWCGYEVANLSDNLMAKMLPVTVLDNGHFPGRLQAGAAAIAQTSAGADGPMDPEDIARIVLEAADAWEGEEYGGQPTITLYHDADDSEASLHSYLHDALLDLEDDPDGGRTFTTTVDAIMGKVWEVIEERTATL